jgi:hypothetical protein
MCKSFRRLVRILALAVQWKPDLISVGANIPITIDPQLHPRLRRSGWTVRDFPRPEQESLEDGGAKREKRLPG